LGCQWESIERWRKYLCIRFRQPADNGKRGTERDKLQVRWPRKPPAAGCEWQQDHVHVNDLNAGLTQVLDDGTNTYLYGNDRIAQLPVDAPQNPDYFLGDALGSVRQMADESGVVVYTASYDPYGEVLSTNGEAQTSYGYAGEQVRTVTLS
jgi:hypothetical protein